MKYLNLQTPSQGRALAYEDLDALEKLAIFPQNILRGMGDCVIDGCALDSTGLLNGGVVWLGGRLYEFPGGYLRDSARNVDNKYLIVQPTFTFDPPRLAAVGGTVPGLRSEIAVLTDKITPGQPNVKIDQPDQTIRLAHRLQELTRGPGVVEWFTTYSATDYVASGNTTGLGKGRALGWALCNGLNDTVDLRGRFVLGHNPGNYPNYSLAITCVRDIGGEERVTLAEREMPSHRHRFTRIKVDSVRSNPDFSTVSTGPNGAASNQMNSPENFTDYVGGGQSHQNMPPYYVLLARQWIGLP
jgi:hypothetical protein